WLAASWAGATSVADILLWPGAVLAVCSAVYTAFLFAQAKGRDFWQNPLLSIHLLAHALLAGGAVWLLVEFVRGSGALDTSRTYLIGTLVLSLITILAEVLTTPPTADAHVALRWIVGKPMGRWFWGAGIGLGHLLPLALLVMGIGGLAAIGALAALAGLFVIEWL